ncbi:sodium-coupled monocarboxylate transporter 1-like isoform X2 [Lineus longissimus]|uniref:sodium-coupled monocarboxylate transporter 1-like isoform X2 n=1 Tax=Lineus longissimus TaxID=88925 RepID=UPI002B4DDA84
MGMSEILRFHWADYILFVIVLIVSAAIGVYYGFTGLRQKTTSEFFLGGRNMPFFPVTISILASFISAVSILGTPAEIYTFGIIYVLLSLSYFVAFPVSVHIYLPMFHKLNLTSCHEYLELRFNALIRILVSILFIIQMLMYMAVVIYAPALAFSQVSGLATWISILSIGIVCTFYTSLGGMKAVMWTDVFQMFVVYAGLLTVIIQGTIAVGGADKVWARAKEGSRLKILDYDADPLKRHSFWTLFIGGSFTCLTIYGSNQAMVQRYLSMKKLRDAQKALYFALGTTFLFFIMLNVTGLVMYAYYHNCDPKLAGLVTRGDQILPHLVLEIFHKLPGIAGLFMACVFSAALSTVSSGLNSLATVVLEDLVKPIYRFRKRQNLDETTATIISKILAITLGVVIIALAFLSIVMPSTLVQIAMSIFGMLGGPILAIFTVGMFLPFVNSWGATAGLLCSTVISLWLGIGAVIYSHPLPSLPVTTKGCNQSDITIITNGDMLNLSTAAYIPATTTSSITANARIYSRRYHQGFEFIDIYKISYLYYSLIALVVTLVISSLVSLATGCNKDHVLDRRLFHRWCGRRREEEPEFEDTPSCSSRIGLTTHCVNQNYRKPINSNGNSLRGQRVTANGSVDRSENGTVFFYEKVTTL